MDTLADSLRASLAGDTTPDRAKHLKTLAELYRQAAALAKTNPPATATALLASVRAAAATLLPAEALRGLRSAVAARLSMVLPTDPATLLDDATRATANELFLRLAEILKTLE